MKKATLTTVLGFALSGLVNASVINVSLNVSTADGVTLKDSAGAVLADNSLIRIGYFYNPTNGAGLTNGAIQSLYQGSANFTANNSALLANFLEIGTGRVGFTQANGLGAGVLGTLSGDPDTDRVYGATPYSAARLDDDGNRVYGTFFRGWFDTTLGIWSANSVSPFNTLDSVKLTGALLSAIIYNSDSDSTATELMVVRALGGSELPINASEVSTFAIATDSAEALIGSALGTTLSATFSTIPEPGSISLVALGGGLLLGLRRKISRQA